MASTIKPQRTISTFEALDRAIAAVRDRCQTPMAAPPMARWRTASPSRSSELDTALNRVSTVRGLAGDLLNQAERMGNTLLAREEQVEAQRVGRRAVRFRRHGARVSRKCRPSKRPFRRRCSAYASIQKLSLLNYIS